MTRPTHVSQFSESMKRGVVTRASLALCLLVWVAGSSAHVAGQASRGAHRHPRLGDVRGQVRPDVEVTEVTLEKGLTRENVARSRDGRYEAFTAYHSGQSTGFSIYFVEKATGKAYEVRGLPLPHRPFSDLVWTNNRTLVFDRWSQPHYGIHYAVNVRRRKLVAASAFPDEFYLEQQRPKPTRKRGE